jgi:hypothetical protein
MTDNVLHDKGCCQKMAQTLIDSEDLQLASKDHDIMQEAMEAVQKRISNSEAAAGS